MKESATDTQALMHLYTISQVAELLGLSEKQIFSLKARGKLPFGLTSLFPLCCFPLANFKPGPLRNLEERRGLCVSRRTTRPFLVRIVTFSAGSALFAPLSQLCGSPASPLQLVTSLPPIPPLLTLDLLP